MKAKNEERRQAIEMRSAGRSVAYISEALKVAKSSVSTWTRGIVSPEETLERSRMATVTSGRQKLAAQAHKARRDREKVEHAEEGKRRAEDGSLLYAMGCMLYWGEGNKGGHTLRVTNTDAKLIKLFHRFLKEELKVEDKDIGISVFAHGKDSDPNNLEISEVRDFWAQLLGVPAEAIRCRLNKGDRNTGRKKNRHRFGACTVAVHRVELLRNVLASIEYYATNDVSG